jgi:heat shock protein HslJ
MPRFRSIVLLTIAATIPFALVACTSDREPPTPTASPVAELDAGEYRSASLASTTVDDFEDPADALDLTIVRDGGDRLTVNNGCNTQSGPFQLEDGVMTVTQLVTTMSGCIPPHGDAGVFLDEFLSEPVNVTRSGDDLVWTSPLGEIVFKTV